MTWTDTTPHSAPNPEDPSLQTGNIRSLLKRMLRNGLDMPVRLLQSLRVGRGNMTNFDGADGAIIANGSNAEFVMGDQAAPSGTNYALWRYANSTVFLDSQNWSQQYQIRTDVLSTQMQKSLRVGAGNMIGFDGGDGRIVANGSQASLLLGDQNAPSATQWAGWGYNNHLLQMNSWENNALYAVATNTMAHAMQKSLRVGSGTGLNGYDGQDGIILSCGPLAALVYGDRGSPSTLTYGDILLLNGTHYFQDQTNGTYLTYTRSNKLLQTYYGMKVGTTAGGLVVGPGTGLDGAVNADGMIGLAGANSGIFIGDRNTPNAGSQMGMYRVAGVNRLWDNAQGDWLYYDSSNRGTYIPAQLSVGHGTATSATLDVYQSIWLARGANNLIHWGSNGVAPPGANSTGAKLILYDSLGTITAGGFQIGIESGTMWFNSGNLFKFYTGAREDFRLNQGVLNLDYSNVQPGSNPQLQFGNSGNTAIGSNRNGSGGGVNTDANQLGIDTWIQGTRVAAVTYSGYTRFGYGSGMIANQPQYNNAIVGTFRAGGPGTGVGAEQFLEAWAVTTNGWDVLNLSYYNVLGTNSFDNFCWIFGRSVNGTTRNFGPYLVQTGTGWGINTPNPSTTFHVQGNCYFAGPITKAGGGFLIDHPLKPDSHDLYHGFVEAPRSDLLYRGTARLVNGEATINIDTDCVRPGAQGMSPGTFAALTRDAVVTSLVNQSGPREVFMSGPIINGQFTIQCQGAQDDIVSWVVMAERNDPWHVSDGNPHTNTDGTMILEREKLEAPAGMVAGIGQVLVEDYEPHDGVPAPIDADEDMIELAGYRGYPRYPEAIGRTHPRRRRVYQRKAEA